MFQNFQFAVSKCCVSLFVRRSFYPVTTIVCAQYALPQLQVASGNRRSYRKTYVAETVQKLVPKTVLLCAVNANYWVSINQVERRATHCKAFAQYFRNCYSHLFTKFFFLMCACVCVCVLCAYACVFYAIVSQTNFCATSFGIPQETLEWVDKNFENFKCPGKFKISLRNKKNPLLFFLQYKLINVFK